MTSLIRKSLRRNRDGGDISSKPKGSEITVNLLDGDTRVVYVDRKDKGQVLLNKVLNEIDLNEDEYFGLCWRDKNGLRIWLDPEKPIRKQLASEESTLDFTVRFYAEDPCQLTEEYTRYFFCLQIKQDLLAGRLPCSFYTGALLASYAVQAEVGDYDPDAVDSSGIPTYIREMEFVPGQNEEFECQVAEFHKSHNGQTPSDAEMNMLDKVKRLELYGVDLHLAMDLEGIRLYIGISPTGIRIYQAGDMVRMNSFNWAKVLQVSFHRDKFYIQLRPSEKSVVKDKIGFRIPSVAACKVLWKSCVDHHSFFRLYVAEKRMPSVLGLFRSGSKYRASVRGTQKQALERSKSCHALADHKLPVFERTPSQRIGKSKSEGAINLLGSKPYVRNSFYDTYRNAPSDERLNQTNDSFTVTTTVSPLQKQVPEDDHVYNNMENTLPHSNIPVINSTPIAPKFVPPPPPSQQDNEKDIPLYTPVVKPKPPIPANKPPIPANKPPIPANKPASEKRPNFNIDSNRASAATPPPSNVQEAAVEYDSIDEMRAAPVLPPKPINGVDKNSRKPPIEDKIMLNFDEKEEKLPWHDKSQYNLDDEWLELDRLTQDVARMTDDLAMDLDLDGPEKNVYVVNPKQPTTFNATPREAGSGYGTPPPVTTSPPISRSRDLLPQQQESPSIINDTPSAADIMKKWHQRERQTDRQTKSEVRSYH